MLFKALGKHTPPEEAPHEQRTVWAPYSFHSPVTGPSMTTNIEQQIEYS